MKKIFTQKRSLKCGSTVNNTGKQKVYQGHPKAPEIEVKSGLNTYTPLPQQERIKQKYVDGMSIRRIAREEGKARETITKIVRSPDMEAMAQAAVHRFREQIITIMDEIVPALVRAIKHSPDGGMLAYKLADRFGAIPPRQRLCPRCKRLYR